MRFRVRIAREVPNGATLGSPPWTLRRREPWGWVRLPREKRGGRGQGLRSACAQKLAIGCLLLSKRNAKPAERRERKISHMPHCLCETAAPSLRKVPPGSALQLPEHVAHMSVVMLINAVLTAFGKFVSHGDTG